MRHERPTDPRSARALASRPSWSWRLGRFLDIDVYLHGSFLLLLGLYGAVQLTTTGSALSAAVALASLATIFLCVLLHEYGHALVARHYGVRTRHITLLPIGGIASLESMPEDPRQELAVAVAGPAVNLVIAAGAVALLGGDLLLGGQAMGPVAVQALLFLATVNGILFAFNLLPALPMDGGRVLRAFLALRMERARATAIAARVGRFLALGLGVLGLFGNPFLVLIALFVWIGAGQEAEQARARSGLRGASVAEAMSTRFLTLSPADDLRRVAELLVRTSQRQFPVLEGERVVGVLDRGDVARAYATQARDPLGPSLRVGDAMRSLEESARPGDALEGVFQRLQAGGPGALPVLEGTRLVGWITRDNLREFLALGELVRHGEAPA